MKQNLYHGTEIALLHIQKQLYQIMEHLGIEKEDTKL